MKLKTSVKINATLQANAKKDLSYNAKLMKDNEKALNAKITQAVEAFMNNDWHKSLDVSVKVKL